MVIRVMSVLNIPTPLVVTDTNINYAKICEKELRSSQSVSQPVRQSC